MTNINTENTGEPKTSAKRSTPKKPRVKKIADKVEVKTETATVQTEKPVFNAPIPKNIPIPSTPASQDSMHLSDEFIPPSLTGAHPIIAKKGFVATPVMALPMAMTQYAGGTAVFLKYEDAPAYIESLSIISRGSDGLARYADCVIAVETQKHYDARIAYKKFLLDKESTPTGSDVHKEIMDGVDFKGTDILNSPGAYTSSKTIIEP